MMNSFSVNFPNNVPESLVDGSEKPKKAKSAKKSGMNPLPISTDQDNLDNEAKDGAGTEQGEAEVKSIGVKRPHSKTASCWVKNGGIFVQEMEDDCMYAKCILCSTRYKYTGSTRIMNVHMLSCSAMDKEQTEQIRYHRQLMKQQSNITTMMTPSSPSLLPVPSANFSSGVTPATNEQVADGPALSASSSSSSSLPAVTRPSTSTLSATYTHHQQPLLPSFPIVTKMVWMKSSSQQGIREPFSIRLSSTMIIDELMDCIADKLNKRRLVCYGRGVTKIYKPKITSNNSSLASSSSASEVQDVFQPHHLVLVNVIQNSYDHPLYFAEPLLGETW